jgi:hypothetical protein
MKGSLNELKNKFGNGYRVLICISNTSDCSEIKSILKKEIINIEFLGMY